jgi:hypothetical protein
MPYKAVDLSQVLTYPISHRTSRVALQNLVDPDAPAPSLDDPGLVEVAQRILQARRASAPVIWMMGAHVVKRGLARLVIELLERGVITHLAGNGAVAIHDFEIAMNGKTSEDVARSLEDGSFGMAEETGREMNLAIRTGADNCLGMGEALGEWISRGPLFPYRSCSLLFQAYRLGIPFTIHVAIGTDIIHQHPLVDFAATGFTSGQDFKIFAASVCELEGGVFCNFGSAVIGPEVFIKSLSIARNLGNQVRSFTTANFDLVALRGDYRQPVNDDNPEYYYRPRKNIINRPVSLGGIGFHINADHCLTIPNLLHNIRPGLPPDGFPLRQQSSAAPRRDNADGPC